MKMKDFKLTAVRSLTRCDHCQKHRSYVLVWDWEKTPMDGNLKWIRNHQWLCKDHASEAANEPNIELPFQVVGDPDE